MSNQHRDFPRQHCLAGILFFFLVCPVSTSADDAPQAAPVPPPRFSFQSAERRKIDDEARALPEPKAAELAMPFYGGIVGWLVSAAPFLPDDEANAARVEHGNILASQTTVPAPPEAVKAFHQLVRHLPATVKQDQFQFTLTVVDAPGSMSWTSGAGFVYITDSYLRALLGKDKRGIDQLAFVLAHELGHIERCHTRHAYRLLAVERDLSGRLSRLESQRLKASLGRFVSQSGNAIRLMYSQEQEFSADLFAIKLCEQAGFDTDNALDALRGWSSVARRGHKHPPGPWHAAEPIKPAPLVRLHRLRSELEGNIHGDGFGLHRYRSANKEWSRIEGDVHLNAPPIVFLHGMDSRLAAFDTMIAGLIEQPELQNRPIVGLQYPGDGSLSRSARFLRRELRRCGIDPQDADFVCHSAGGLVFRHFAEVDGGQFGRAVFLGTPHHGSDLAELRPLLEVKQFFGDLKLGYTAAVARTITDGEEQITDDLKPGSLFLTQLAKTNADHSRYTVFRGQAFGGLRSFLLQRATSVVRSKLVSKLGQTQRAEGIRLSLTGAVDRLKLPSEVLEGDLVVSLESASLPGVSALHTVDANHGELIRSAEVIASVCQTLSSKK